MTQIRSGERLVADRYVLRALVGRGGSGAVWRGEDLHLRRTVAIKQIVLSDHASTRTRTRAMREAQAAARLRHPGVVQLYDVHDDGSQIYLVMELVRAPSLSRVVRRHGPFAPDRTARMGHSLLETLIAVHTAGIVHRDIKPSNVLVGDCGVHITDFGIALLGDDPMLTSSGSVLGTPAYMAPEQARGERVGPEADLYGLGATLYFALEGRAPFADTGSVETTRAVRDQPHRPGEHLGALAPVIDGLLAKDPTTRPDLATIASALDAAAGRRDVTPSRPPADVPHDGGDDGAGRPATDTAPPDPSATPPSTHTPPSPADTASSGNTASRPPAARSGRLLTDGTAPTVPGPPGSDDDRRQTRQIVVWTVILLALLAIALVALFLAVRGHPEAPATAAATMALRPTMWVSDG